jgi:hypothetical protein
LSASNLERYAIVAKTLFGLIFLAGLGRLLTDRPVWIAPYRGRIGLCAGHNGLADRSAAADDILAVRP